MKEFISNIFSKYEPFSYIVAVFLIGTLIMTGYNEYEKVFYPKYYVKHSVKGWAAIVDTGNYSCADNFIGANDIYYSGCQSPRKKKHYFKNKENAVSAINRFVEKGGHEWFSGEETIEEEVKVQN